MNNTGAVVAIDFETATAARSSACAVGLAYIENGRVAGTEHYLIRPPGNSYNTINIGIHGITPADTADQPSFDQIWSRIWPGLEGRLLIAHNAPFDRSVLVHTLDHYGLPAAPVQFKCTLTISRAVWPELPNHKLPTVASHLGITLKHHDAASDAAACAEIALAALRKRKLADIQRL